MSAPEPRSTPGRSTGTPEPSQAASEACGAESAHDGVVWEYVGDDWREKTCATCGGTGDAPSSVGMVTDCSDCEGTGHVLAASEADRGAAMDALVKRLGRVLGNVPIGTRDLVNVLTGPDVAPWTSRVLAAVSPEGGEVARLREALEQVRALADLMRKIDHDYHAGTPPQRPTNAVTAISVAARLDAILASVAAEARGACTPERVMAATGWSRERIAGLAGHFGATLPAPDETAADDDTLREAIGDAVWDVLSGFHEVMDVEARADEVADAVLAVLRNRGLIQ